MKHAFERGFTLIEMVIYVAIFIIFTTGLFFLTTTIISSRVNYHMTQEVNYQGSQVVNSITQAIRNGSVIHVYGDSVLIVDQVIFSEENGVMYATEVGGDPVPLTNSRVSINDLVFTNLSQDTAPSIVRIRFTATSSDNYFNNTFYGTAGGRK